MSGERSSISHSCRLPARSSVGGMSRGLLVAPSFSTQSENTMTEKRDRHFLEAFAENAEALLDLAVDNEAVKGVPVVGTLFKLFKGYQDLSSRILAAKLQKFLSEPSLRNALEARKLRQQILQNSEEA